MNRKANLVKTALAAMTISTAVAYAPASSAAAVYSTDFESPALADMVGNTDIEDFLIGNIIGTNPGWFPGTFGAPANYNNGYSRIVEGEGGVAQGAQQVSIFSDYNDFGPFPGNPDTPVQTFVYRDVLTLDADDVGNTFTFQFDGKLGNIDTSLSESEAFIKVLQGPTEIFVATYDSGALLTAGWSLNQTIDLLIADEGYIGGTLQIGFRTTAENYSASGVFYDNLCVNDGSGGSACPVSIPDPVPVPAAVWLFGSGLIGLVGVARRRKS